MTLTDQQTSATTKDSTATGYTQGVPHMVGIFQVNGDPVNRDDLERLRQEIVGENLIMTDVGDPATGCVAIVAAGFHGPSFATHRQISGNGASREKEFWCVCDGRIDNPEDLLPAFRSAGIRLQDHSAAEMVLAAYRLWGTECPIRLIGDYAFAVWDPEERQIFCARDPALYRTFYYTFDGKRFAFASDPRTLLKAISVSREYDNTYLTTYMVKYSMNWERTPWERIKQIPGGCALCISRDRLTNWRWWDLKEEAAGSLRYRKREQYYEHIRSLMDKAVGARMRNAGDGPISIATSRGIDSNSIAATALNLWRSGIIECRSVQGITVPIDDHPEADESKDAVAIARHLGLEHILTENKLFLGDVRMVMQLVAEPFLGIGIWDFWDAIRVVCVASNSKVLMSGVGGHELFAAGSTNMAKLARERRWLLLAREISYWLRNDHSISLTAELLLGGLKQTDQALTDLETLSYRPWIKHKEQCVLTLQNHTYAHPTFQQLYAHFIERGVGSSWFERGLFSRSGIELRDPLLDRRLVEFAWLLPVLWKIHSTVNKPTFRQAFERELPLEMPKRSANPLKYLGKSISKGMKVLIDILNDSSEVLSEVIDIKQLRDHAYKLGSSNDVVGNYYILPAYQIACWIEAQENLNYRKEVK